MVELKKKFKAYISYEYDIVIREVLLEETLANAVDITIDGNTFSATRIPPQVIIDKLISVKGATITPTKVKSYNGKEKVFGIIGTKSRTMYINTGKYIRVRILADTLMEMMEKISKIKQEMAQYNVKDKVCIWDREGKINTKAFPEEVVPTVLSDFSSKMLQVQKRLELQTMRDESYTPEETEEKQEVTERYLRFKDAAGEFEKTID